jgi:rod shape-determining protein MreD
MATRSLTDRRELEQHTFPLTVTLLVPFVAVVLQALLPRFLHWTAILDLPLIATIFFSVGRRSPVRGTLTGALIGCAQDALTGQPIGVNGIAKSIIGYIAASIGVAVDVDHVLTRTAMNFLFVLLQSVLLWLIEHRLLGMDTGRILWVHELWRAVFNMLVAVPIFYLLDRTRVPEQ